MKNNEYTNLMDTDDKSFPNIILNFNIFFQQDLSIERKKNFLDTVLKRK